MLMGKLMHSGLYNWHYHTEPEAHLNGRRIYWPRGKVLGGSSTINGMIYVRGNALDYDRWAQMGLHGWSYAEVLPYFRRSERHLERRDVYHGRDGSLAVCRARGGNELFDAFDKLRQDVTIIIVEHNLDLVLALADRAYVLERGTVVHEGPARPLLQDLDLRRQVLWL